MSDCEDLLEAVRRNPKSDAARLAFAEWLELNGRQAESEFIRIQLEIAAKMGDFDPFKFDAVDMYLDPQDEERQSWKHDLHRLMVEQNRKFSEIDRLPVTTFSRGDGWSEWADGFRFTCSPEIYLDYVDNTLQVSSNRYLVVCLLQRGFISRIGVHLGEAPVSVGIGRLTRFYGGKLPEPVEVVDLVGQLSGRHVFKFVAATSRGDDQDLALYEQPELYPGISFVAKPPKYSRESALVDLTNAGFLSRSTATNLLGLSEDDLLSAAEEFRLSAIDRCRGCGEPICVCESEGG